MTQTPQRFKSTRRSKERQGPLTWSELGSELRKMNQEVNEISEAQRIAEEAVQTGPTIGKRGKSAPGGAYKTEKPLVFDRTGRCQIYHAEGAADYVHKLTRVSMLFVGGSSFLLVLEIISPFFGWWHGMSLMLTITANMTFMRWLHYYSTRFVNNIWLHRDGQRVEIDFLNAFFVEKKEFYNARNFGYLKQSRLYNMETFRHKQIDDLFINQKKNMYHDRDYRGAVNAICQGRQIWTGDRVDRIYVEEIRKKVELKQKKIEARARKAKKRI